MKSHQENWIPYCIRFFVGSPYGLTTGNHSEQPRIKTRCANAGIEMNQWSFGCSETEQCSNTMCCWVVVFAAALFLTPLVRTSFSLLFSASPLERTFVKSTRTFINISSSSSLTYIVAG